MNITPNMIFFVVSLLVIGGLIVYTLGEMLKRLRIRVMALEIEIRKSRKAFTRFEKHKRKMLVEQRQYLKIPLNQEKERV